MVGLYNLGMRATFPTTVHLFFIREGHILLSRRLNTGYRDGEFSVPAGHLDGNETVVAAGVREAREEVGLHLNGTDLLFSSVMHRLEDEERVDFFLRVRAWEGDPYNNEPDKCSELRWVALESLPDDTVPYVRRAIGNHLGGVTFDEFGWTSNA